MERVITDTAEFMSKIAYLYDSICHPCTDKRIKLYKDAVISNYPQGEVRILDMGCCTGETAFQISNNQEQFYVMGIDISLGMIEVAREKSAVLGGKVSFEVMDMKELRFDNSSFDVAYSNSLEWINSRDDLECVIKECARCLKQGGLLLLDFPSPERFIKVCRMFYAENIAVEDGTVYKLTRYETPDIGTDLRAMQTYIHISGHNQLVYTGKLKWRLHTPDEIIAITRKYNFSHTKTYFDYNIESDGNFMQMLFHKKGD